MTCSIFCIEMLRLGLEAFEFGRKKMGSFISMRSTAECRGPAASLFTFHLDAIALFCLVCFVLGWCLVFVVFVCFFAPDFFARLSPGANRASSSFTTYDWMTVGASSAHRMSSKKNLVGWILTFCLVVLFGGAWFVLLLSVLYPGLLQLILSLSQYDKIADRPCLELVRLPRKKKNYPPSLTPGDCCTIHCQQPCERQPTIDHCFANNTWPSRALKGKCPNSSKGVSTKRLQVQILLFSFISQWLTTSCILFLFWDLENDLYLY